MNPISVAIKGKGPFNFIKRGASIARNYGITANKMDRTLAHFAAILRQFDCSATFPITAVAVKRNPRLVRAYQAQGIEFAMHGYRHLDHSQLSKQEQVAQIELARQVFDAAGLRLRGFRSPYLRWNCDTLAVLEDQALAYDSSQGLYWDVLDGNETPAYRHVLDFYGALSAEHYPSLPKLEGRLVRIPYNLPDDEALIHRLRLETPAQMNAPWLAALRRSYELGEMFTLGLHPERAFLCQEPLLAVLAAARQLSPAVWIARLDEVADWWRARSRAEIEISAVEGDRFAVAVTGPDGTTVLSRGLQLDAPTRPWADGYEQVLATSFTFTALQRPWIGLAPTVGPDLQRFLRQQGYLAEISRDKQAFSYYLERTSFAAEDERPLLAEIEGTDRPLVRLGRWPDGARSALAVSGDIDALTLWDYGLRLLGR